MEKKHMETPAVGLQNTPIPTRHVETRRFLRHNNPIRADELFPGQAVIFNRDCRSALLQFNDVPASWATNIPSRGKIIPPQ